MFFLDNDYMFVWKHKAVFVTQSSICCLQVFLLDSDYMFVYDEIWKHRAVFVTQSRICCLQVFFTW